MAAKKKPVKQTAPPAPRGSARGSGARSGSARSGGARSGGARSGGARGGSARSGSGARGAARLVADNKKARRQYEVLETVEAGIALRGTEVKTLRDGKVHLEEAYARVIDGEVFLIGSHIDEYTHGNRMNHEPTRRRKLLLRKAEIKKLTARTEQKGLTLIPLKLYFNERGYAKITLGVCRGRKLHDKRETQKTREAKREIRSQLT